MVWELEWTAMAVAVVAVVEAATLACVFLIGIFFVRPQRMDTPSFF
jgi:hypothetical protein